MVAPVVVVACHKPVPHPSFVAGYRAVCNQAPDGSKPMGFDWYDDDGYPDMNRIYCELSALRAVQVSGVSDDQLVGLVHYRRTFSATSPQGIRVYDGIVQVRDFDWARPERWRAGPDQLAAAVVGQDWVTAPRIDVRLSGRRDLLDAWKRAHPAGMIDAADRAIRWRDPSLPSFGDYLAQTASFAPFNMFLGSGKTLDEYTSLLWPVLDRCVSEIGTLSDPYQSRYAGFLAERLHTYWIDVVAKPSGMSVSTLPVVLMDRAVIQNSDTGEVLDFSLRRDRVRFRWPIRAAANARVRIKQRAGARRSRSVDPAVEGAPT